MKITNLTLLFLLLFLCFATVADRKMAALDQITQKKMQYNLALEAAVDDAAAKLVEVDSRRQLILNKEKCTEQFFQALYAAFGVDYNPEMKNQLRAYVPAILITTDTGYYIQHSELLNEAGDIQVRQVWTNERPYAYEDEWYVYAFTLQDYLKAYDKESGTIMEGRFGDLAAANPGRGLFRSKEAFDETRRKSIVGAVTKDMEHYINQHNRIAEHYRINYNFALPVIQQEDWYRTIDDISLFTVFQGYPYGAGTQDVYNRYAFAGARIKKSNCYYITKKNGEKEYHKAGCDKVTDTSHPYYSKKECALEKSWPCKSCLP